MGVRKTKILSMTLPEAMLEEVDRACELEHRNRSELMREALRHYLRRVPSVEPTRGEVEAFRRGRAEHGRGEYVTLDELKQEHDVATHRRQNRSKKAQTNRR
jgi:predicted transcriptional regulator